MANQQIRCNYWQLFPGIRRVLLLLLFLLALAACQSQEMKAPPATAPVAQAEDSISLKQYPKAKVAQERLHDLYNRLKSIKASEAFAAKGFGPGYAEGNKWMADAVSWRDEAKNGGVPVSLQDGYDAIIALGNEYMEARLVPAATSRAMSTREEVQYDSRAKARDAIDLKIID